MQIVKPYISSIAKGFWKQTGLNNKPPYDINGAVNLILPVDIVNLSELSLRKIEKWLNNRNVSLSIDIDDRSLHGFIITFRGSGFIFINGTDPESERRYTVAHEVSHFILDYKIPRDRTVEKLGISILEVLDGFREPELTERIDGALTSVNVQPYTHLLEKTGDGSFERAKVFDSENDADTLSLELLAPLAQVIKEAKTGRCKSVFSEFKNECYKVLVQKYGLPASISKDYSSRIAYLVTGGPSILTKLGL